MARHTYFMASHSSYKSVQHVLLVKLTNTEKKEILYFLILISFKDLFYFIRRFFFFFYPFREQLILFVIE